MGQVPVQVRVPVQVSVPVQVTTTLPDGTTTTGPDPNGATTLVPDPNGATTLVPDPTGKTTLGVTQIIIDDTGIDYLQAEDGSQGGDGRTWANADETTVKRSDGTYDMPYKPGKVIDLNEGDEYTTPGKVPVVVTESTSITSPLPPDKPESQKGLFPSTGAGDYPVVLEIEDINIVDPGFGYDANDKVIVGNGAELKIKTDDLGSVTGVDVINGGIGYTEDPDILIKSNTGYNAKLMPIFKVNRVGEDIAPETVSTGSVISVIDCVGKF